MENIQGVIFDFDGTIADSMDVWKEIDRIFLGKRDIEVPPGLQKEIAGMGFSETAEYFKNRFDLAEECNQIKREWKEEAERLYMESVPLKKCAVELIRSLAEAGISCAIGSSNEKSLIEGYLRRHGLLHMFSQVMTSCEAGRGKPHADLFLRLSREMGISPGNIMVIEDIYEGILAARRAGMTAVAVYEENSYKRKLLEKEADKYIMSLCEISVIQTGDEKPAIVFNT